MLDTQEVNCAVCSNIAGHDVQHFKPQCSQSPSRKGNVSYDLDAQRKLLVKLGIREEIVGNDHGVWTTVERIPVEGSIVLLPSLDKDGNDLRGDRSQSGGLDNEVTRREVEKQVKRYNSLVKGEARGHYVPVTAEQVLRQWRVS